MANSVNPNTIYALSHDEITDLLAAKGHLNTFIVRGGMGIGKSSLLGALGQRFPSHKMCYFDATTKSLGDLSIPQFNTMDEQGFVTFVPNEELGLHLKGPVIIMIDEMGKAATGVKRALTRFILEKTLGEVKLHPDSIVFATSNLGAEGVGDMFEAHQTNRMSEVHMAKPDHMNWIEWGINNGIDATLLGWVKDNPQLFQSFEDVKDPEENPYIFHPRAAGRTAFVTPRSLEKGSNLLVDRGTVSVKATTAALIGTIGARGAMDLMTYVSLADKMPSLKSIIDTPLEATVPDSAAAICMVVYRALSTMEAKYVDPWMQYLVRLDREAQGMFANGVRSEKYSKRALVMTNKRFTKWAMDNGFLFASDVV